MKKEEKRMPRSYKVKESAYKKAMRRAKKGKGNLASLIEMWVVFYAEGYPIGIQQNVEIPE